MGQTDDYLLMSHRQRGLHVFCMTQGGGEHVQRRVFLGKLMRGRSENWKLAVRKQREGAPLNYIAHFILPRVLDVPGGSGAEDAWSFFEGSTESPEIERNL
jgi:hypothetical protein